MRSWIVGGVAGLTLLGTAMASPPVMRELMLPVGGAAYAPADDHGGGIPSITPGASLGIACADIRPAGTVVQVVMQIAHTLGESATGYEAVLATDQRIDNGAVHVRVPDVPGLSQHTVNVRVYVTDSKGTHSCDGGRVRIG